MRKQVQTRQSRCERQAQVVAKATQHVVRQTSALGVLQAHEAALRQRLTRFEHENATNEAPVQAVFRLDAGFGTWENVVLLIEMGYEVYTRPHNPQVRARLLRRITDATCWTRVGANAEMVAWPAARLNDCPYPADFALAAFAANFVRWAAHWLSTQCYQEPVQWLAPIAASVKALVQVAAHTPARVEWLLGGCCLLRFTDESVYAGRAIQTGGWAFQLSFPLFQSYSFEPFYTNRTLIAQPLR